MTKRRKKRRRLKKRFSMLLIIILLIVSLFCLYKIFENNETIKELQEKITEELNKKEIERKKEEEEKIKKDEYDACLEEKYSEENNTEEMINAMNELSSYLKRYNCSVSFYDIDRGYEYNYNPNKVYYAASTIKMLDALYIYSKAGKNDLDLNEKVKYKASNYLGASKEMKKYKVGDKVSLKNLVKYAITVSDNTAHSILVDYIGFKNLKEYGNSLGAKYTLVGDIFGEINTNDSIIYLKELNKFIEENKELGEELKQYFLNSEQNYLDFPEENIKAGIKYGEYELYYHENGIVYSEHPYLVSILTTEGKKENIIRDVNKHIYNLQSELYKIKENNCKNRIYQIEEKDS